MVIFLYFNYVIVYILLLTDLQFQLGFALELIEGTNRKTGEVENSGVVIEWV